MGERFHAALRYWAALMALYYGTVFLALLFIPAEAAVAVMILLLLFVHPIGTLICAGWHGLRCGFWWMFGLGTMFLLLPLVFFVYNMSAWVYVVVYGALALGGDFIGSLIRRRLMEE